VLNIGNLCGMNVFKLLYLVIEYHIYIYIYYPWLATVTCSCFSNFKGGAWLVQPLPKTKETLAEAHGSATRDAHFFINTSIWSTEQNFFSHLKKVYMLFSLNYNPRLFNHNYISYKKGMARLLYLFGKR
jgi:hypothetical protein